MRPTAVLLYCLLFHLAKGQFADYDEQQEDDGRIIRGTNAWPGMIPPVALVVEPEDPQNRNGLCTACVIKTTWVASAAHCFKSTTASNYKVLVGSIVKGQGTRYNVTKIIWAPDWDPDVNEDVNNDLALLKTDPMVLNAFVGLASLPIVPLRIRDVLIIPGYGQTHGTSGDPTKLQVTVSRNVPLEDCFPLDRESDVCMMAINDGGVCFGDSGGPLLLLKNGTYYIYGVNSNLFSYECETGLPNVGCSVWYHLSWIKETMLAN